MLEIIPYCDGGPRYRTRMGIVAVVLRKSADGLSWEGRLERAWCSWRLDGSHEDAEKDLISAD